MQLQHRCSTTPQQLRLARILRLRRQHQGGKKTSWPLAFTSMMSTSRMESATCSTYHNHVYHRPQSSTALRLPPQNGLVNFEHTSTSASLSTSTSWTSPTMLRTHLQPTSWCSRHQQDSDNILRLSALLKHVRTSKMKVHNLLVL